MISSSDKSISLEQVMPVMLEQLARGSSVRLYPKGTSMLPMIRQGVDSVELSPLTGKLKKYDLPLYRRDNGQYVLHRIVQAGDTYTCIGDNQLAYEQGVREDQLLAVVTGFYRKDKYRPVKSLSYRCYCRLWHWTRKLRYYWTVLKIRIKKIGT